MKLHMRYTIVRRKQHNSDIFDNSDYCPDEFVAIIQFNINSNFF